jgi:CheY-like chemotaxis protein
VRLRPLAGADARAHNQRVGPNPQVLVIDDDDDARELLAALVARAGYSVATACNGREALALLRDIRPAVIFLDVVMPDMDGLQFRQEQRRNKDWIKIPTIVMTGVADEPMLDVAVEETLRKPVRARQLLEIVARHCTPHAA